MRKSGLWIGRRRIVPYSELIKTNEINDNYKDKCLVSKGSHFKIRYHIYEKTNFHNK